MPLIAKSTGSPSIDPVPSGSHVARCCGMIHIGTIEFTDPYGEQKKANKVRLTFELPQELFIFKEENGEQPRVISQEYTLSLHDKATLRHVLESWRGKKFTPEELDGFDLLKVVGKECMINVVHTSKGDKVYPNIASISPLPKGLKCPPQINPTKILTYEDWNEEIFESLPQFLKDKMASTPEFKSMNNPQEAAEEVFGTVDPEAEVNIDDVPF